MLREYLQAAMDQATYEILPEDNTFYGEIPVLPGRLGQRGYAGKLSARAGKRPGGLDPDGRPVGPQPKLPEICA